MPSAVPAPLAAVAPRLRCPACGAPLAAGDERSLRCAHGHNHDVARHGYVSLLPPGRRAAAGDDAGMVQAREHAEQAGHLAPLIAAVADATGAIGAGEAALVLDVGGGTGHQLAAVLDALGSAHGVVLDASVAALRRAGRAHARIAAVRGDVWRGVPLVDAAADVILNVFAPRHGGEFARVLRPGGSLIVVTPGLDHLGELRGLHGVGIDEDKAQRLRARLGDPFALRDTLELRWTLALAREQARAIVAMGPGARHLVDDFEARVLELPEPVAVTAAVRMHVFTRR